MVKQPQSRPVLYAVLSWGGRNTSARRFCRRPDPSMSVVGVLNGLLRGDFQYLPGASKSVLEPAEDFRSQGTAGWCGRTGTSCSAAFLAAMIGGGSCIFGEQG